MGNYTSVKVWILILEDHVWTMPFMAFGLVFGLFEQFISEFILSYAFLVLQGLSIEGLFLISKLCFFRKHLCATFWWQKFTVYMTF